MEMSWALALQWWLRWRSMNFFSCMLKPTTEWVREQLVTACAILEESLNTGHLATADAMETSDAGACQEFWIVCNGHMLGVPMRSFLFGLRLWHWAAVQGSVGFSSGSQHGVNCAKAFASSEHQQRCFDRRQLQHSNGGESEFVSMDFFTILWPSSIWLPLWHFW